MPEHIAVIGTGYVGLVSGTCFAEIGHHVVCVDRDSRKIEALRTGVIPIYEPGLDTMVARNAAEGRLRFTTSMAEAVAMSDIIYIAVGTPSMESGDVDMSQIRSAVEEMAGSLKTGAIVVIKSTVPVGTAERVKRWIREVHSSSSFSFSVVSNPEFLREGSAIRDTFHMDRVVIGSDDPQAAARIAALHEPFGAPVVQTNHESAELIKYAANAFLATKISFINEMANVCEKVGADVRKVAEGMGLDHRIGAHFLQAGIGYGGTCFPKDTKAHLKLAENVDYDFKILRSVITVNQMQRIKFVHKIERALDGRLAGRKLAVMGLSFKPNTDDLRDAPSLDIIRLLLDKGADVCGYDPVSYGKAAALIPGLRTTGELYAALQDADAMVVVTEWNEIKTIDWTEAKRRLKSPLVVDGRNVFDPEEMQALGFRYIGIGTGRAGELAEREIVRL